MLPARGAAHHPAEHDYAEWSIWGPHLATLPVIRLLECACAADSIITSDTLRGGASKRTIDAMSRYAVGFSCLIASHTVAASGPSWHQDSLWSATVFARARVTSPCSNA
jgi:hypothetical protein